MSESPESRADRLKATLPESEQERFEARATELRPTIEPGDPLSTVLRTAEGCCGASRERRARSGHSPQGLGLGRRGRVLDGLPGDGRRRGPGRYRLKDTRGT
jgi:hypothetical protein